MDINDIPDVGPELYKSAVYEYIKLTAEKLTKQEKFPYVSHLNMDEKVIRLMCQFIQREYDRVMTLEAKVEALLHLKEIP